jgi:hypothetical protein
MHIKISEGPLPPLLLKNLRCDIVLSDQSLDWHVHIWTLRNMSIYLNIYLCLQHQHMHNKFSEPPPPLPPPSVKTWSLSEALVCISVSWHVWTLGNMRIDLNIKDTWTLMSVLVHQILNLITVLLMYNIVNMINRLQDVTFYHVISLFALSLSRWGRHYNLFLWCDGSVRLWMRCECCHLSRRLSN